MPKDWDALRRKPPAVPRIELPSLQGIRDSEERFYLTMYLTGAQDSDQETAKARCAAHGIDYETARDEARRTVGTRIAPQRHQTAQERLQRRRQCDWIGSPPTAAA